MRPSGSTGAVPEQADGWGRVGKRLALLVTLIVIGASMLLASECSTSRRSITDTGVRIVNSSTMPALPAGVSATGPLAAPVSPNLKLHAIRADGTGELAAIISAGPGEPTLRRIGDDIGYNSRLAQIARTTVVVRTGNGSLVLTLPPDWTPPDAPATSETVFLGLERTSTGYRVGEIVNVDLAAAGLQQGDLVVAVNGAAISDPESDLRRLYHTSQDGMATLSVRKGGATVQVALPIVE